MASFKAGVILLNGGGVGEGRMEVRGDPGKPRTKLGMGRIRGGGSPGPPPPVKDLDFIVRF